MNCLCLLCLLGLCRSMGNNGGCGQTSAGVSRKAAPAAGSAVREAKEDCGCGQQAAGNQARYDEPVRGYPFADTVPHMEQGQPVSYAAASAAYAEGCSCHE